MEDWMTSLPPCMGGKRPRSPVEKLADLQGHAEAEDEDNWRNSKRYLSEVIANGFSRLNFGLRTPSGSEQQQHQLSPQLLNITSPRGPGGCYIQLPGGVLSPREGDCDMDMDSPPACPGSASSAGITAAQAAAMGMRTSRSPSGRGNRPNIVTEELAGRPASPMCSPAGGASGHSPVQYPFSSYVSPGTKPLPPPAWHSGPGATGAAAGMTTGAGSAPAAVPKALIAAEKAPNSPSDLPAAGSNLRKVALLRSLLARTEQQLQQQQQQQQPQHGQLPHQQQREQQQQELHAVHGHPPGSLVQHQQQQQQQQQQYGPVGAATAARSLPQDSTAVAAAPGAAHTAQHGCDPPPGEHQQAGRGELMAAPALAAGAAGSNNGAVATLYQQAACSHNDAMECSSSSMCDGDGTAVSHKHGRAAVPAADADLASSSLLCTEVLPLSSTALRSHHHQHQQQHHQHQQQHHGWLPNTPADCAQQQYHQAQGYVMGCAPLEHGSQLPGYVQQHTPWVAQQQQQQQQHHMLQQQQQQQLQRLEQQDQQQQGQQQQRLVELSAEQLQQLRAKALASTSRLTELEPEDLASLQLSISASQARRGSADHTPSHLQDARAAAEARRHSSHI